MGIQLKINIMKLQILFLIALAAFFSSCQESTREEAPCPNILFAVADDASWKHFGAYGCNWVETPAFESVARGWALGDPGEINGKCHQRTVPKLDKKGRIKS